MTGLPQLHIRLLASQDEARRCAGMMASSEPWITLRRGFEASLKLLSDPGRESYAAFLGTEIAGFIIIVMKGAFVGYVQTICTAPERRGSGIGTELIRFAEERIFRDSPNVFICVSSFNHGARRLYERLGYEAVGELSDYVVRGHSEILLRKSIASAEEFQRACARP